SELECLMQVLFLFVRRQNKNMRPGKVLADELCDLEPRNQRNEKVKNNHIGSELFRFEQSFLAVFRLSDNDKIIHLFQLVPYPKSCKGMVINDQNLYFLHHRYYFKAVIVEACCEASPWYCRKYFRNAGWRHSFDCTMPLSMAYRTRFATSWMFNFCMMFVRWVSTVRALINSFSAIC